MSNHIMLSFIIPTFNPDIYIEKCIESIMIQDVNKEDFEIIIVLNGDKEPYYEKLFCYVEDLSNVTLLHTDKKGVSNARNVGVRYAKGSHVVFLDDDDFISGNFIRSALLMISKDPNAVIIYDFRKYFEEQKIELDYNSVFFDEILNSDFQFSSFKYRKLLSSSCGKVVPKKIIDCKFKDNLEVSEDAVFMFEISKNFTNILLAKDAFYMRRIRENSVSRSKRGGVNRINDFIKSYVAIVGIYIKDPLKYDFLFFVNRLMAITKYLVLNFFK